MPPVVPAMLDVYLWSVPRIETFETHSIAPKLPSPAAIVAAVTSGKNRVSRGNRTIGVELTEAPAGAPLATEGWKTRVTVALVVRSGLKSQRSLRICVFPGPGPRPAIGNQPFVEAGEEAASALVAQTRQNTARKTVGERRSMGTSCTEIGRTGTAQSLRPERRSVGKLNDPEGRNRLTPHA